MWRWLREALRVFSRSSWEDSGWPCSPRCPPNQGGAGRYGFSSRPHTQHSWRALVFSVCEEGRKEGPRPPDLLRLIRDRNPVPCIGSTSLSHWTTREVPGHGHFDCIGSDSHWSWLLKDASEQIQESKISGSHLDKFQNEKDIWSGSLSPSCSRSKEFLQL